MKKYIWYVPALYVALYSIIRLPQGLAHSQEFIDIISLITPLKGVAYYLTPLVGIFDFCVGVALLLNPLITKNLRIQKFLFVFVMVWPFVPASLRYFGGVGAFEFLEILSVFISALIAYVLWQKYSFSQPS